MTYRTYSDSFRHNSKSETFFKEYTQPRSYLRRHIKKEKKSFKKKFTVMKKKDKEKEK